ncbi:TAP-like protein-domain-containing protein [Schizothecium vesticola]|uniref:TAP-like protein-domain-containing protein n=1 Tax=Schizothecium vesticola TaxID=314040 RepID=A0AA40F4W8_9PEZI|nr:TAP-like protein-domain-containing protein [Schizothecium vesticola]
MQTILSGLCLAALAPAAACSGIQWRACPEGEFNTTVAVQCGTLRVPLDYTQPDSSKTLDLELVKIPAAVQPSRGSIQLNFGGPGQPTRQDAVALGPLLQVLSGGEHDLLAFDPRGTGKTARFVCTADTYYIGQMIAEMRSGDDSDTALRRLWERGRVDGRICQQQGNGNTTAEFIGTAFVARDMMRVAEAVDPDGLLRYWGFSYGTTLGATLAAMFPEKVDKMIIDGVQNPHDYYHSHADFEEWSDMDSSFSTFFTSCISAGPSKCALARLGKTAAALEADVWAYFDTIRARPLAAGTSIFDLLAVKSFAVEQLRSTAFWPEFAELLAALVYSTEAQQRAYLDALMSQLESEKLLGPAAFDGVQSLFGIHCGDRTVRLPAEFGEEAEATFERLRKTSRLIGDNVAHITAHCAQWPWRAKETYMGDFKVKTRRPVLVASNTRDGFTPLRSAMNVSEGLEGSGLLVVNGTGHAVLNTPSVCSFKAIAAYWKNGTLPAPGAVCESAPAFDGYSWANVIEETKAAGLGSPEKRELYRRVLR